MGAPQNYFYGQAGGAGPGGYPISRFQIAGDPSEFYPIWAAGSLDAMAPAFLQDNRGGAYRYGAGSVLGGVQNMISDGTVLRSIIGGVDPFPLNPDISLILAAFNAGALDQITGNVVPNQRVILAANPVPGLPYSVTPFVLANGEFAFQPTNASGYGAVSETFSFAAATLSVTAGSNTVTSTLANAFGSASTLPGYGYTPGNNSPGVGDLILINQGGTIYSYRICACPGGGTTATIAPAWQGTTAAGLAYTIIRTGYGSWSNVVRLFVPLPGPPAITTLNLYYAGQDFGPASTLVTTGQNAWGTINCIQIGNGPIKHFMAPQTSAPATAFAVDVEYYKGFLLYGAGPGISWSVAGFPSSNTTAFGATDLPALNTSAFNTSGNFYKFARIGEQVLAIFDDSIWLVQATGSVPEFAFYRLPGICGAAPKIIPDPVINVGGSGLNNQIFGCALSSVSGPDSAYYQAPGGSKRISGLTQERLGQKIESIFASAPSGANNWTTTTYDDAFGGLFSNGNSGLLFTPDTASWSFVNTGAGTFALSAGEWNAPTFGRAIRNLNLTWWKNKRIQRLLLNDSGFENTEPTAATVIPNWIWASPIISVGDAYEFIYGGFRILARAALAAVGLVNLTWSVYGGASPYAMVLKEGPLTVDYSAGTPSARDVVGTKQDDAFLGFVLTGTNYIELAGIWLYNANSKRGR